MSSDNPPAPVSRPQRPRRPAFDPRVQPWVPSHASFGPVPPDRLTPAALRDALSANHQRTLDIPDESVRWFPGREGDPVEAAVLVPMVMRPQGVSVLLTQRTAHLNDYVATALRETEEETGLSRTFVEVLGGLPRYVTGSGFAINPITSLVRPGFDLTPDVYEVAEIFEVPLAFLTDPANYRLHRAVLTDGTTRQYYSVPWQQYFIWGATAAMLRGLCQILSEAAQTRG